MRMYARGIQAQWGVAVLRLTVGAIFLAHGLQKVLITGMPGVAEFMAQAGIPLPMTSAILVSAVETLCGMAFVLGVLTRWAAVPLAIDMLVAMIVGSIGNSSPRPTLASGTTSSTSSPDSPRPRPRSRPGIRLCVRSSTTA